MRRREFLDPKRILRTAGQIQAALTVPAHAEDTPPVTADALLLHFSRLAMATVFEVVLPFGQPHAHDVAISVLDLIDALEEQLSVYREESEVSRINREAMHTAVSVEEQLFGLLLVAHRIYRETKACFDIAMGQLIKAWGFFRGSPSVPTSDDWQVAFANSGMHHVLLSEQELSIRLCRAGVELNLGSIGKGYALDRAIELLAGVWGIPNVLLHGGRSSVMARGSAPGTSQGWVVGIKHPWNEAVHLGRIRLRDQALGTSAATYKHLIHEDRRLGHILDPRTGWPASGIASASVVAPSAAEADALATAFYVGGVKLANDYCATHAHIGALLLEEGTATPNVYGKIELAT